MVNSNSKSNEVNQLLPIASDIKKLIEQSRQNVAVTVNAELTTLYWNIGKRIKTEVLGNERAAYGETVIKKLAEILTEEYGSGCSKKQLMHCLRSAQTFPEEQIVSVLRIQLS